VVRNLTDFGAFVEIVPGVDGLVHISDMSWTRRITHPSEVVQKGQELEAVITSVDVLNQRISLSMKELLPNEWEEYANAHGVGDVASGSITNITDFGVFVELSPGVEGLCHISEIDRDAGIALAEMFTNGQKIACRILRIDWNENRIGLSMHGVDQEGAGQSELEAGTEGAQPIETAMSAALRAGGVVEEEIDADGGTPDGDAGAEVEAGETAAATVESEADDTADEVEASETEEAVEEPEAEETAIDAVASDDGAEKEKE
jgi:small subunit ribosomal protein S1